MKRSVPISTWLFLLLITAVMLSACERPVPEADGGETTPVTDPVTETDGGEQPAVDPAVGEEGYPAPEDGAAEEQPPAEDGAAEEQPPAEDGAAEEQPPAEDGAAEEQPPAEDGATEEQPPAEEPAATDGTYTVQANDTLFDIAQQFGVSVADIVAANNLANENNLDVGQVLTIPPAGFADTNNEEAGGGTPADEVGDGSGDEPQPGDRVHVVQPGENLFRIGLQYGFTVDELASFNGITNPARIDVGQIIRIPPAN